GRRSLWRGLGREAVPAAHDRHAGRHRAGRRVRGGCRHHHRSDDSDHGDGACQGDRDHAARGRDQWIHPNAVRAGRIHPGRDGRLARARPHVGDEYGHKSLVHANRILRSGTSYGGGDRRRGNRPAGKHVRRGTATAPAVKYRAIALGAMLLLAVLPMALAAQDTDARLKSNREELDRIRRERAELQQRMNKLQSSAHSLNDELKNINKQHDATKRVVSSLDQQLGLITDEVKGTTSSLVRAEDEAEAKRAILNHRLVEIYKRGPLFDFQALLSADSFGELIARYKYLHEIAVHDRALVKR